MILVMCKVQTMSLNRLATVFEPDAESLSSMNILFSYALNLDLIAYIVFSLLHKKCKPHFYPLQLRFTQQLS